MNQRLALVTGSNRGIGYEVCRQLAEKGLGIILTSRNPELGQMAANKLKEKYKSVWYCQLDVTRQESINEASGWVQKNFGKLDVLVNNAGIAIDARRDEWENENATSLFKVSIEKIRTSFETNTLGPIRVIQNFVELMKKNNYGRIVNISSGMGQLKEMNGGWPGYRISKTALNAVTRIAADELMGTNILVNSACPGWVRTDMGGPEAELSVEEGADTIVWLATLPEDGPSGGFFRQRKPIDW